MADTNASSPKDNHPNETDSVRYSNIECDAVRYSPEGSHSTTAAAFYRPSHPPPRYPTDVSDAVRYTPRDERCCVFTTKKTKVTVVPEEKSCEYPLLIALPEYCTYDRRLQSFRGKWPKYLRGPLPEEFARSGFVYHGEGDKVQCFSCGVKLHYWEPLDSAYKEHARWFSQCQYLMIVRPDGSQDS